MTAGQMRDGLNIFLKYEKPYVQFTAEHDQIWLHGVEGESISKADLKKLEKLNWFFDESVDAWSHHT